MIKIFSTKDYIDASIWVTELNHLLGVEINDYSKPIFDSKFNRNFGHLDKDDINNGSLGISDLKFIDDEGYALDYLEYMSKYYPDHQIIAEAQYVCYR